MTTYDTPVRTPLRRPTEGRVLGGVAAGLSRHGGVDPLAVRIAFVVVPLALVPHVLAWILVPSDAEPQGRESRRGRAALVAGAPSSRPGPCLRPTGLTLPGSASTAAGSLPSSSA